MRKAFSMLTAIFVILLMATVAAFILNISGKGVKATVFQYKKEQAVLYAKSYTELAIMAATANDSTSGSNCAQDIDGRIGDSVNSGDGYDIQTRIAYIGNDLECSATRELNDQSIPIITPDALHIIVDVYVSYRDSDIVDMPGVTSAPWITYHRRTLQKL